MDHTQSLLVSANRNQPIVALDLLTRFLGGDSYVDKKLPIFNIAPKETKEKAKKKKKKYHSHPFAILLTIAFSFCLGLVFARFSPLARRHRHDADYQMVPSHEEILV